MARLAGQTICVAIDQFEIMATRVAEKEMVMERLARHLKFDCPECFGCTQITVHEQEDHMHMAKQYALTCKQPARHHGDLVRCPDGFYGKFDATSKKLMPVTPVTPVTTKAPSVSYWTPDGGVYPTIEAMIEAHPKPSKPVSKDMPLTSEEEVW